MKYNKQEYWYMIVASSLGVAFTSIILEDIIKYRYNVVTHSNLLLLVPLVISAVIGGAFTSYMAGYKTRKRLDSMTVEEKIAVQRITHIFYGNDGTFENNPISLTPGNAYYIIAEAAAKSPDGGVLLTPHW
jgi:hypothetical protein